MYAQHAGTQKEKVVRVNISVGEMAEVVYSGMAMAAFVPVGAVESGRRAAHTAARQEGFQGGSVVAGQARAPPLGAAWMAQQLRAERRGKFVVTGMKKQPDGNWSSDDESEPSSDKDKKKGQKSDGEKKQENQGPAEEAADQVQKGASGAADSLQKGAAESRQTMRQSAGEARSSLESGVSSARGSMEEGMGEAQSELQRRAEGVKNRLDSEFPPKDPGKSDAEKRSKKEELQSASAEVLKNRLVTLAAASNRGQAASATQRDLIEVLAKRLEDANPNPDPVDVPLIDGVWDLIYSSVPLFKTSPFLLGAATPLLQVGQVRQTIFVDSGEAINEVSVTSFPAISGRVITTMRIAPVSGKRLECKVEKTELKGGSIAGRLDLSMLDVDIPVQQIYERVNGTVPETYFDTVYLDELLRISRSKNGALYVFVKEGK